MNLRPNQHYILPKPRLFYRDQQWVCHDNYYLWGYGKTPEEAFIDWRIRDQRRTRVARRGVWNIQSCKEWFSEGCWLMRYYLGNKQIFGYDPHTDELILRG